MRAIKIDPKKLTIEQVEIDGSLQSIYEQIESDVFCMVRIGKSDWIYLDDMGLYREKQYKWMHEEYPAPLTNIGLILGDEQSTTLTLEEVADAVYFDSRQHNGSEIGGM